MPSTKKTSNSLGKPRAFGVVSTRVSVDCSVERHLRLSEAASLLGVSRATMYRFLAKIRHLRIPAGGLTKEIILIPESSLAAFLSSYERIPGKTTEAV